MVGFGIYMLHQFETRDYSSSRLTQKRALTDLVHVNVSKRKGINTCLFPWQTSAGGESEGGASYVPLRVPYMSRYMSLTCPLRVLYGVPYVSFTESLTCPLRSPALFCTSPTSYVPYVSLTCPFTCPVRVPYVSLTCPGVRVPYLTST